MRTTGRAFIVEDDAEVRKSWECVLGAADIATQCYASAEEFLDDADCNQSCCVVLDLRMPGMGGQKLLETIRARNVTLPVIMISGHADVQSVIQTMKMGLTDFLIKPVNPELLVNKVRDALRDADSVRIQKQEESVAIGRISTLSDREKEVLTLLVRGKPHKQIAQELGISIRTIDHHHARINGKMQADSLVDLARMAAFAGIL